MAGGGSPCRPVTARPDVEAALSGSGPSTGFSARFAGIPPGTYPVCAYAINVGPGTTNPLLGCRTVTVASFEPVGALDEVTAGPGSISVRGWALDFDTPDPIDVHLYVDGGFAGVVSAADGRSDIGAFFRTDGRHGFSAMLPAGGGRHSVCAFGINVGKGSSNTLLGCRSVVVPGEPFGNLEGVTRNGLTARVSGWVIDPDTTGPVDVHVYVGAAWGGLVRASVPRADVGAAFPRSGPDHGFSLDVPLPPGSVDVCVFAINQGPGASNPRLGCRRV